MLTVPPLAEIPDRVARRLQGRRTDGPTADPALSAYLNEQLAAVTGLAEQLRRASALEALLAERSTLLRVRRELGADRTALRAAMRELGVPTDWTVVGASWISARAGRLLPLLHRLPYVERLPTTHPTREATVEALLVLEDVLGSLHRRAVAARLLNDLLGGRSGFGDRAQAQLDAVEAAHRRCAAPLLAKGI